MFSPAVESFISVQLGFATFRCSTFFTSLTLLQKVIVLVLFGSTDPHEHPSLEWTCKGRSYKSIVAKSYGILKSQLVDSDYALRWEKCSLPSTPVVVIVTTAGAELVVRHFGKESSCKRYVSGRVCLLSRY